MKLSPNEFIKRISPIAMKLYIERSTIFPSLRIAQSAHETGWTIHDWNNLVGFKVGSRLPNGYWKGAFVNKGTWEVYDGKRTDVVAAFRAYDTIEDCFRDQDELFKISRYDRVRMSKTPNEQADMLYACGYATDPHYSQKLKNIMQKYNLYQFDQEANEVLERVEELQHKVEQLSKRLSEVEQQQKMNVPDWAKEAIEVATTMLDKNGNPLVDTPDNGSFDFYRLITVLHRAGLLDVSNKIEAEMCKSECVKGFR